MLPLMLMHGMGLTTNDIPEPPKFKNAGSNYFGGGAAEYHPKKHNIMSWAKQRRMAKKRRRARQ